MYKPLDFDDPDHKSLLNRIASGNVVLFLGSGFSLGAVGYLSDENNHKIPIPNVQQLKEILSKKVLYIDYSEGTLKEICEDCQEDNGVYYAQIMRDLFRISSVENFHKLYAEVDWKSIFTTNVDNIIESVYDEVGTKICPVYSESPKNADRGVLRYYKLHGDANLYPEKITFSVTDYISNSARKSDCRFEALSSALKTENFLFIGTSLTEEWDFDIQCQQADIYIVSNKTYFVLKEYNDRLVRRIRRRFKNAILIQESAESFICKVKDFLSAYSSKDKDYTYEKWNLKQLKKQNYDAKSHLKPNLYLGAEPTWEDIFSNHDVIWEKTEEVIRRLQSTNNDICTLIVGKPISGKTTMLYRLGATLCETLTILEYSGDNLLDDLKMLEHSIGNSDISLTILVDDANWILGRIERIVQLLENSNIRLIATVSEKEYEKRQHLFDDTLNSKINLVKDINRLTKKDYGLYLEKLNEKSFLGQYSRDYHVDKQSVIDKLYEDLRSKKEDPLLMLAYKMKYGDDLEKRILDISNRIIKHNNYNLKRFVVLLYFLDVIGDTGLKLSLFLDLYPMKADLLEQFVLDIEDLLVSNINRQSWENSDYSKITIHARFSEIVKKAIINIEDNELEELVEDIFRRMDNIYHYKCRQSNSYQNYVLYTLLRSQNVSELFRDNKSRNIKWKYISQLYENLHEYFDDYHLYWLHRGISEVKMKKYSSATIHLEQARVTRQFYSYEIEHAFAMLYFERSIHSENLSRQEREHQLEKALEIIRLQIGKKENDAFSIHSFIIKTIQFYQSIKQEVPDDLMKEMLEYYYLARKRFQLDQSIIRRNMLMCIYKYLSDHNKEYSYNLSITQEELAYVHRRIGVENVQNDILDLI